MRASIPLKGSALLVAAVVAALLGVLFFYSGLASAQVGTAAATGTTIVPERQIFPNVAV